MRISATDTDRAKLTIGGYSTEIDPGCLTQLRKTAEGGIENRGWRLGIGHEQPQSILGTPFNLSIKTEGKRATLILKDGRAHKAKEIVKLKTLVELCDEGKTELDSL